MANPEHVRMLRQEQGVKVWNKWREQDANRDNADLSDADFHGVDLSGVELITGYLRRANLSLANLSRAVLLGADLRGANLSKAILLGTDLRGADLTGADLREAEMNEETKFGSARITGTTRYDPGAKLRGFRGIDVDDVQASIERLSVANPKNVLEVAASQLDMLTAYHKIALKQSERSFRWALIGSGVGLGLFIIAVVMAFMPSLGKVSTVPVIGGAVVNVISGIVFVLYGRTTTQLSAFHGRLEVVQRYLLANSICEQILGDTPRNSARAKLVDTMAKGYPATAAARLNNRRAQQAQAAPA